jgi:hypothetical protein
LHRESRFSQLSFDSPKESCKEKDSSIEAIFAAQNRGWTFSLQASFSLRETPLTGLRTMQLFIFCSQQYLLLCVFFPFFC